MELSVFVNKLFICFLMKCSCWNYYYIFTPSVCSCRVFGRLEIVEVATELVVPGALLAFQWHILYIRVCVGVREVRIEVTLEDQLVDDAAVCEELFTGKYCSVFPHKVSFHPCSAISLKHSYFVICGHVKIIPITELLNYCLFWRMWASKHLILYTAVPTQHKENCSFRFTFPIVIQHRYQRCRIFLRRT